MSRTVRTRSPPTFGPEPRGGISRFCTVELQVHALLAHSAEHFHGKEEVVSSILTEGSKEHPRKGREPALDCSLRD